MHAFYERQMGTWNGCTLLNGDIVFVVRTEVFHITALFRLTGHSYTDYMQVYISVPLSETQQVAA